MTNWGCRSQRTEPRPADLFLGLQWLESTASDTMPRAQPKTRCQTCCFRYRQKITPRLAHTIRFDRSEFKFRFSRSSSAPAKKYKAKHGLEKCFPSCRNKAPSLPPWVRNMPVITRDRACHAAEWRGNLCDCSSRTTRVALMVMPM